MVQKLGFSGSYQLFGANGKTMVPNERVHCSKGTFIHAVGYAGNMQYFVVYDDDMNAVEICNGNPDDVDELCLDRYFSPRIKVGETTKPISERLGIGLYYDESEEISDEIIEKSLRRAENLERLKKENEEREQREWEESEKMFAERYAFLERAKDRYDHNVVGRNIRTELKRNFPGVKFSVKKSGYDCYNITWNDGPTTEQVAAIVGKYKTGTFDAYTDYHDSEDNPFSVQFGGCDYIFTNKEVTDEGRKKVREMFPDLNEQNFRSYHFENDIVARATITDSFDQVIYKLAYHTDLSPKIEPKEAQATEPISGDFSIIEYSEKAIAVIGDTKEFKNQLKNLGGKFNPKLRCGAGWIFSAKKRDAVEKFLTDPSAVVVGPESKAKKQVKN